MPLKVTDKFEALDEVGNCYTVFEYTEYAFAATASNPYLLKEGLKYLELEDGTPVKFEDGKYLALFFQRKSELTRKDKFFTASNAS